MRVKQNLYRKFSSYFIAPLWIYIVLFILGILLLIAYINIKDEIYKDIILSFFSSITAILLSSFFIDLVSSMHKAKTVHEIKKAAFIRCNYVLYLLNDLWSDFVEPTIDKYDGKDIFTKETHKNVVEKLDMRCCVVYGWIGQIDSYSYKKNNIITLINNIMKVYSNYIDPKILATLSQIELCNLIQYNLNNLIRPVIDIRNPTAAPIKFPIKWELLEKDFNLFKSLEKGLKDIALEFNNDIKKGIIKISSLKNPIFKRNLDVINNGRIEYNYNPFYGLATKNDLLILEGQYKEIIKILELILEKNGIPIPKNMGVEILEKCLKKPLLAEKNPFCSTNSTSESINNYK